MTKVKVKCQPMSHYAAKVTLIEIKCNCYYCLTWETQGPEDLNTLTQVCLGKFFIILNTFFIRQIQQILID